MIAIPACPTAASIWRRSTLTLPIRSSWPKPGGRIVGTVIGGWDGWRAQIYRLATHPDFRRGGIAAALVSEVERRLQAKGASRIYALVDKRSPPAVPFWEDTGYAANEHMAMYARNFGREGE